MSTMAPDPHRAEKIEIIEGLLRALDDLDAISAAVRDSGDRAEARARLTGPAFLYSDVQADHILDLTVGGQTRSRREQLSAELDALNGESGRGSETQRLGASGVGEPDPSADA
jgi:DNA gyrase/topoisomerase IV subunit A